MGSRGKQDVYIIPRPITKKIAKKYGVEPFYVIRAYYYFWQAVRALMKENVEKMGKGTVEYIIVPYIGKFHVNKKTLKYLWYDHYNNYQKIRVRKCLSKVQSDTDDGV